MSRTLFYSSMLVIGLSASAWIILAVTTNCQFPCLACPFRTLSHIPCPFCGLTHATVLLLHGAFWKALYTNCLVLAVAFLIFFLLPLTGFDILTKKNLCFSFFSFFANKKYFKSSALLSLIAIWIFNTVIHKVWL